MTKKAFLAVCLVVLLPAVSYLVIKYFSDEAVIIPSRYFADTIVTRVSNGKESMDTIWHQVSNITLTNQMGKQVSLDDISGKVILADFFFTSCPTLCPKMTRNMKKLQDALKTRNKAGLQDTSLIQFLSFSVDPERDSAEALNRYAERYGVNPDTWWLLTGSKKKIYDFAIKELRIGAPDSAAVDTNFIHASFFVLLDKKRVVRGFYHGDDSTQLSKLAADMIYITLEKDAKKKRSLFSSN
jgi:protein SCO1